MTTKTQAQRLATIEKAVEQIAGPQANGKYPELDRGVLTRLYEAGIEQINIHITRERQQGGPWARATIKEALGTWSRVSIHDLFNDAIRWFHAQVGGGQYLVELTHPDELSYGILYRFSLMVPGTSKKPAHIQTQEAQALASTQTSAGELAARLINSGIPEIQAYNLAQKMATENPLLAAQLGGKKEEEDDMAGMGGMFQMMMAMQMQQAQMQAEEARRREEREEKRRAEEREERRERERLEAQKGHGLSPELAELKRQNEELQRRLERQEQEAKFEKLAEMIKQVAEQKKPEVDPAATAISSLGGIFTTLKATEAQQSQQATQNQFEMLKTLSSVLTNRGSELDAITRSMLAQQEFALKKSQIEMDAPLKQAEMLTQMVGMMGGLARAQSEIMMSMQGNPALDALREMGAALPDLVQGLIGMDATRGPVGNLAPDVTAADEAALEQEIQAMQGQVVRGKKQVEQIPEERRDALPEEPQAVADSQPEVTAEAAPEAPAEEEVDELEAHWDEALEVCNNILGALGFQGEGIEELLKSRDAVEVILNTASPDAAPHMLGETYARLMSEVEGVIDVDKTALFEGLTEQLEWEPKRAEVFVVSYFTKLKEIATEAKAA